MHEGHWRTPDACLHPFCLRPRPGSGGFDRSADFQSTRNLPASAGSGSGSGQGLTAPQWARAAGARVTATAEPRQGRDALPSRPRGPTLRPLARRIPVFIPWVRGALEVPLPVSESHDGTEPPACAVLPQGWPPLPGQRSMPELGVSDRLPAEHSQPFSAVSAFSPPPRQSFWPTGLCGFDHARYLPRGPRASVLRESTAPARQKGR